MPIYEYVCQHCGVRFEKFVRAMSSTQPVECPECQSEEVEKAFSVFGVGSSSRGLGSTAASAAACAPGGT